jgi:hypothetical protein
LWPPRQLWALLLGAARQRGSHPAHHTCAAGLQNLVEFYGIEASFPLTTHLITRSLEAALPKRLYYVS